MAWLKGLNHAEDDMADGGWAGLIGSSTRRWLEVALRVGLRDTSHCTMVEG